MNLFDILSAGRRCLSEENISSIMAWLIDPNQTHGCGYLFLKKILEKIDKNKFNGWFDDFSNLVAYRTGNKINISVVLEHPVEDIESGRTRDIDIVIWLTKGETNECDIICIENKIKDGTIEEKQLIEEYTYLKNSQKNKSNISFLFITPEKSEKANTAFKKLPKNISKFHMAWGQESSSFAQLIRDVLSEDRDARIPPLSSELKFILKSLIQFAENNFSSRIKSGNKELLGSNPLGHVTKKKNSNYVNTWKHGFKIDLPGSYPVATPAVYNNRLYVSGGFGSKQFYCLDSISGKTIWSIDLDDDGPSTAVIEDDIVVFNTESCTIFACNANTGKMLWSWWLGDPLASAPAISDGKVFTTYPANGQQNKWSKKDNPKPRNKKASHLMGCFNLYTGKILWQKWIDGDAISAPVVDDKEVFITSFSGTVYKFRASDGKILSASYERATSAPTVSKNEIYFTKRSDRKGEKVKELIAASDKKSIREKRRYNEKEAAYLDERVQKDSFLSKKSKSLDAGNGFATAPEASGYKNAASNIGQSSVSSMQSFQGSRIISYENKNYNTMGDELICSNPLDGKPIWKKKIKGDIKKQGGFLGTPPVAVNGKIIVATLNGDVLIFDAKSGRRITHYNLESPVRYQPVVDKGRIYISTQNGKVFCIDTKDKSIHGWPMWGGNSAHTGNSLPPLI